MKKTKKALKEIVHFINDDTLYYSASLSFFTIFSLLPILALIISIFSHMVIFDEYLSIFISYIFDFINPTHSTQIASSLKLFLSNTSELGSIGTVYLLIVFALFMNNYEYVINKIYNIKKRSIDRLFFLYISFFIVGLIIFSIFILTSSVLKNSIIAGMISFLFIWVLISALFYISVNTKISIKASLLGALATLSVLVIIKKIFIFYATYNTTYETIYGSFGVLLLFFLWIYVSWSVYLYGIKLTALLNKKYK